ncbi:TetR/AcrR family transcriptional regulator [Nocardia aurantiaca]|uniref:TetR family transcriptional regulator n=1 Tax=Nocardia aurantiaca TaxID=2675850 RepID=A0A6I3L4Q6_9NOCA|nr:TetR/AcrR family transcriptional regulator [Nocardia aurantiaca]MTE16298.1 TetR family transcriptional regulator [Nocardia aurantiaca]
MSPRAGLTAERITQAAAELADDIGFDNVTLTAVAKKFGVKDPSLYSHVRNLQDLRTRVALLGALEMTDRIGIAVAGRAGRDALVAFANAYRDFAREHPGRYAATQSKLDIEAIANAPGAIRSVQLTEALLRGYDLDGTELIDAGRLLRSTFHGYATLETGGGFNHSRETDDSWARILEALHLLLTQWPKSKEETPQ